MLLYLEKEPSGKIAATTQSLPSYERCRLPFDSGHWLKHPPMRTFMARYWILEGSTNGYTINHTMLECVCNMV